MKTKNVLNYSSFFSNVCVQIYNKSSLVNLNVTKFHKITVKKLVLDNVNIITTICLVQRQPCNFRFVEINHLWFCNFYKFIQCLHLKDVTDSKLSIISDFRSYIRILLLSVEPGLTKHASTRPWDNHRKKWILKITCNITYKKRVFGALSSIWIFQSFFHFVASVYSKDFRLKGALVCNLFLHFWFHLYSFFKIYDVT